MAQQLLLKDPPAPSLIPAAMVQDTTVRGTFVTRRTVDVASLVLLMLLILSFVAIAMAITYPDDQLLISGCVLMGFSVIGLVYASIIR